MREANSRYVILWRERFAPVVHRRQHATPSTGPASIEVPPNFTDPRTIVARSRRLRKNGTNAADGQGERVQSCVLGADATAERSLECCTPPKKADVMRGVLPVDLRERVIRTGSAPPHRFGVLSSVGAAGTTSPQQIPTAAQTIGDQRLDLTHIGRCAFPDPAMLRCKGRHSPVCRTPAAGSPSDGSS